MKIIDLGLFLVIKGSNNNIERNTVKINGLTCKVYSIVSDK